MPERYLGQPLGKYRVESLLGSGGFAWVFKGYDPELDIPVAIKVLKPQFAGDATLVERFRREASTAAKLRHPNIIKIYAVGRESDAVYFVMDYLPGGLADRLEATPHLPEDYVVRIGIDVARALGFAHREGVIHRDIKVDNILFDTHGNAVVADFGIARAVSGYTHQTGTNMVVGTPQYFAPEQARAKPLDGRADIYSLGVTLFRSVTGRLPFEGDDWYEIARQHVEEPPPAPRSVNPGISAEFDRLLLRCLAKAPEERPATGEALAEDLERILALHRDPSASRTLTMGATGGTTVIAPLESVTKPPVRRVSSARVLVPGALVVAGLVTAGVLVFASLSDGGASPPLPDTPTVVANTDSVTDTLGPPPIMGGDSSGRSGSGPAGAPGGRDKGSKGGASTSVVRATLLISAPTGADIAVDGRPLPAGMTQLDTVPGDYRLSASIHSIPGCPTSTTDKLVTLRAGAPQRVSISPRPCGWLELSGEGRDSNNRPVRTSTTRYTVEVNGSEFTSGDLPLTAPLLLPVGTYDVIVSQSLCADRHHRGIVIQAEQRLTLPPTYLICGP